ncbi:MAG: hypothetical protein EBQ92_09165 [Proteobacteria bacterium]|nr:hypothetical protein [Pseudomonadota bacterium]
MKESLGEDYTDEVLQDMRQVVNLINIQNEKIVYYLERIPYLLNECLLRMTKLNEVRLIAENGLPPIPQETIQIFSKVYYDQYEIYEQLYKGAIVAHCHQETQKYIPYEFLSGPEKKRAEQQLNIQWKHVSQVKVTYNIN